MELLQIQVTSCFVAGILVIGIFAALILSFFLSIYGSDIKDFFESFLNSIVEKIKLIKIPKVRFPEFNPAIPGITAFATICIILVIFVSTAIVTPCKDKTTQESASLVEKIGSKTLACNCDKK